MAQLTIEVNAKPYVVGCEDGQEAHLRSLATLVDAQVRQVSLDVGQLGETRLMLMGALLMADELTDAKARLAAAEGHLARFEADSVGVQDRAAEALDAAAHKIEAMARGETSRSLL
ncbi:MAG TPA: cell division protein ZapA [Caulobacteraceae bacterium]|nr:cell division protein ZapA [Caulobacteraceae bacterium]